MSTDYDMEKQFQQWLDRKIQRYEAFRPTELEVIAFQNCFYHAYTKATENAMEMNRDVTLKDVMSLEFIKEEYHTSRAYKMKDIIVLKQHNLSNEEEEYKSWPGKHKNVCFWVELKNGYIVGWNENPARGWSFPVCKNNHFLEK